MLENKKIFYESVVLVGAITKDQDEEKLKEYLDELYFLAHTAGAQVLNRFTQKIDVPNAKTFIGSGKLLEIKNYVINNKVDTIIFDDELSPTQLKNLEKIFERKVIDRTNLILDIFAQRAKTSYARTQVALAQYQYLLPRLTRMWTHLERQRGGIGLRGPGETEIETDRRIVRDRISLLKERLKEIDKQMNTQRKNRGSLVRVALVGYTNAGKSTCMNVLSKSDVFAEDKLFATLDTTVRKLVIKNIPFLLTDTVGFIRKLPTQLIDSFKSTLDEVRQADILVHMVDMSHPSFEQHIEAVNTILTEIKSHNKPTILVFNKIDKYSHTPKDPFDLTPKTLANFSLNDWQKTWMAKQDLESIFISIFNKDDQTRLKEQLYEKVKTIHKARFPYNDYLYEEYDENGEPIQSE